jgi:hypothetical protein
MGNEPAKDKYYEEQRQIVETIFDKEWRKNVKGQKWSKYNGDMTLLVIEYYLEKHLPNSLAISLNSYIDGFPTEFDLIIHKANAKPRQFTHAFNGNDVYALIEVKAKGIFAKDARKEIPEKASKIRENFDKIREQFHDIICCYLTVRETINPKKPTSVNFGKLTRKGLGPYRFCCLKDTRSRQIQKGEWEGFLKELKLA